MKNRENVVQACVFGAVAVAMIAGLLAWKYLPAERPDPKISSDPQPWISDAARR